MPCEKLSILEQPNWNTRADILLVDDDIIFEAIVKNIIESIPGMQFHFCSDPQQALELSESIAPILILQDLVMPGIDGLDLVKGYRNNQRTKDIPIVVISAREEPTVKSQAFAAGANDYIVKTPSRIELKARIEYHSRSYLEKRHMQEMEIQLQHQAKLESIGQLAAGIAHEINTPTQFIGDNIRFLSDGFSELTALFDQYQKVIQNCKEGDLVSGQINQVHESIAQSDLDYLMTEIPNAIDQSLDGVERVAKIVKAMKEFSHPGGDEMSRTDLNQAIDSTLTVARNEWKFVAELVKDLDPDLPPVPCRPAEFNQVILNLVINATHAIADALDDTSQGKGILKVTTRAYERWVEIRIQDTGTGIPDEAREKIFDPFFTTKPVGKGTGQGLAIAHNVIVDRHNGLIDFETKSGQGTTFIIRLPMDGNPLDFEQAVDLGNRTLNSNTILPEEGIA